MAALASDRNTPSREGDIITVPVKKGAVIHAGSLVASAAGIASAPTKAASLVALGRAEESVTGGAADGDVTVRVRRGVFAWGNSAGGGALANTDIGADAYIADDQTVTKTDTGSSKAGKVLGVDSDGVWVETR